LSASKPQIKLFIACSLDGYIARENNTLDWLHALPNPKQLDYGYHSFLAEIDTLIMGRTTYEEILGFGVDWPYGDCNIYVLSRNQGSQAQTPRTRFLNELNKESLEELRRKSQKNIWIVGGGQIISQCLALGEVDELILSIIPIILGDGIRLFPGQPKETWLELVSSKAFETGVVNLHYQRQ
jgi:dihydrofolate reductase